MRRTGPRMLRGALLGCVVALAIFGVWSLPAYMELSLDARLMVDQFAICLWPAALFFVNLAFYARDPWDLGVLVAEYVTANAVTYALLFALGGWIADAARWLRHRDRPIGCDDAE